MRVDESNLAVGLRVQRGADWDWDNQDGGAGKGGSVIGWKNMGGVKTGMSSVALPYFQVRPAPSVPQRSAPVVGGTWQRVLTKRDERTSGSRRRLHRA